jgi:hypothetical protein
MIPKHMRQTKDGEYEEVIQKMREFDRVKVEKNQEEANEDSHQGNSPNKLQIIDISKAKKSKYHARHGSLQEAHKQISKQGLIKFTQNFASIKNSLSSQNHKDTKNFENSDQITQNSAIQNSINLKTPSQTQIQSHIPTENFANNQILIINPKIDASTNQIMIMNDFRTHDKKLKEILESGSTKFEYFQPSQPGSLDMVKAYKMKRMVKLRNERNQKYFNNARKLKGKSLKTRNDDIQQPKFSMIQGKIVDTQKSNLKDRANQEQSEKELKIKPGSFLNYVDQKVIAHHRSSNSVNFPNKAPMFTVETPLSHQLASHPYDSEDDSDIQEKPKIK